MMDGYIEILVKRNVDKEKSLRKKIIIALMISLIIVAFFTKFPLFCFMLLPLILGYYFMVWNYYVEFEYFYMDRELIISKIYNRSRRKEVLTLNDGMIKLIAPISSDKLQKFNNMKKIDCTTNESFDLPYVMICEHNGELKVVNIQMTNELYKEFKKNMPDKVQ